MKKLNLSLAVCFLMSQSSNIKASDLDIFSGADSTDKGNSIVTLMLDKSGSMKWTLKKSDECPKIYKEQYFGNRLYTKTRESSELVKVKLKPHTFSDGTTVSITVPMVKCYEDFDWSLNEQGRFVYTPAGDALPRLRETRWGGMKKALWQLLTNENELSKSDTGTKYMLGMGFYPHESYKGFIGVPAKELTIAHRVRLIQALEAESPNGGTPIAAGYAEAGAYMMGTNAITTKVSTETKDVFKWNILGEIRNEEENYTATKNVDEYYCYNNGYEFKKTSKYPNGACGTIRTKWRWARRWWGGRYKQYYNVFRYEFSTYQVTDTKVKYHLYKCEQQETTPTTNDNNTYYGCAKFGSNPVQSENSPNRLALSKIGYDSTKPDEYKDTDEFTKFWNVSKESKTVQVTSSGDWSGYAKSSADTKENGNYKKPPSGRADCGGGSGIFFLTDGRPNSAGKDKVNIITRNPLRYTIDLLEQRPPKLMNKALKSNNAISYSGLNCNTDLLAEAGTEGETTSPGSSSWGCIGQFAQKLFANTNPSGETIRTATAGFGPAFNADLINKPQNLVNFTRIDDQGNTKTEKVPNCELFTDKDAYNLCKLGDKNSNLGQGGAYFVKDGNGLITSLKKFFYDNEGSKDIQPISTGIFSMPVDPIDYASNRFDSYLPLLEPNLENNKMWKGNLKKYKVQDGSVKGAGGNVLTSDGNFNTNTRDYWNRTSIADKGLTSVGGVFDNMYLSAVFDENTSVYKSEAEDENRNLFVETVKQTGTNNDNCTKYVPAGLSRPTVLTNVSINSTDSKVKNFECLDPSFTNRNKIQLANFLGYPISDGTVKNNEKLKDSADNVISFLKSHKHHGAVLHSKPKLITTQATIKDGKVTKRSDYILYGSFDGTLRIVDDRKHSGDEIFTFIPQHIIKHQGQTLIPDSDVNKRKYGIDATWSVYTDYKVNTTSDTNFTLNNLIIAGGLRMGGSKYYAMKFNDQTFNKPELLYSIGSEYGPNGYQSTSDSSADASKQYGRMGQTWAEPSIGYVKIKESGNSKVSMVHFLPGGYDLAYENGNHVAGTASKPNQGNAVYMVKVGIVKKEDKVQTKDDKGEEKEVTKYGKFIDTKDAGKRLWWASSSKEDLATNSHQKYMTNSIVTKIVTKDRDYDGLTDHIYYADLGGQVFRADIDNSGDHFKVTRVVRLLNVSDQKNSNVVDARTDDYSAPRFYESPLVTFMRWKGEGDSKDKIVGVVSVGSGNRSKPLKQRNPANPDRIYMFLDEDVARNDELFGNNPTLKTSNLKLNNLAKLDFEVDGSGKFGAEKLFDNNNQPKTSANGGLSVRTKMTQKNNRARGWYYDLKYWLTKNGSVDRVNQESGLKLFNNLSAANSVLFFTSYNSKDSVAAADSCSASVKGRSQRDTLCLPFGACKERPKYNPMRAGKGIVENSFGLVNMTRGGGSNDKTLVGIIKNEEFTKCDTSDPDCNPLNSAFSTKKGMRALDWQER